jgi:LPXTG-motif cell wall-anchored protein
MVKRIVIAIVTAVGLTAAAAVATPAGAQQYPPAGNLCTVSDTTVSPGQSITLTCGTYLGGATVTFTFFSAPVDLGSATADGSGVVTAELTIPQAAAGAHTITATGQSASGPLTNSVSLTVSASGSSGAGAGAGTSGTGGLPRTGDDSSVPLARAAIVLVAAGGALVFLARRRRATTPVHL